MMKYCTILVLCLLSVLGAKAADYTVEQIPNVHVADKSRYVSNPDGILSDEAVGRLDALIGDIWAKSSAEVVAVAVKSIGEDDVNDFATRLFEHWGIGKKDKSNGVLVLVVEKQRRAVIRTGYGSEGLLPDIICGRIIRNDMAPYFRRNDYDAGMLAAVKRIHVLLTDPEAAEELQSAYANDVVRKGNNGSFWNIYRNLAAMAAVLMLLCVVLLALSTAKKDPFERYHQMKQMQLPSLVVAFMSLGMGLPAFLLVWLVMRRCRSKKRICPNCKSKMHKLSEEEDNKYLTPAQDMEERLNSVDYDVWLCGKCGEVDVFPFINKNTPYQECPACRAKASMLVADRLIQSATAHREGRGVKVFRCRNCGKETQLTYVVPKDDVPVIVPFIGGFGSGRGGGFGGFGGGSFGGGLTGGGGASGGW